jgi:hypothetical protein
MRLALFVTCIIATHTASAYAQTFVSGRGGVNYATFSPYLGDFMRANMFPPSTRPVITISGLIERQIASSFSLKSGLEYAQVYAWVDDDFLPRTLSLSFLELPLLAQWNGSLFTPALQIFVNFGPIIRYNVSLVYTDGSYDTPFRALQRHEIQEAVRPFDMPLQLGIGIGFNVDSNIQVYGDARYIQGVFNISSSTRSLRTYASEGRLGLGVRLRVGD